MGMPQYDDGRRGVQHEALDALSSFVSWLKTLVGRLENVLFENRNQYACRRSILAMVAK